MKATEAKLLEFLKKSPQFVIPIYQRTYSWGERECRQLWDDIVRTGRNDAVSAHFVGSIVYVEKGLYSVSSQSPLLVIDGQQRLTTVTLLIEALARSLGESEPLEGFSAKKLRNYYLLNPPRTASGATSCAVADRQGIADRPARRAAQAQGPLASGSRPTSSSSRSAWPRSRTSCRRSARGWRSWWSWTSRSTATRTTRSSSSRA